MSFMKKPEVQTRAQRYSTPESVTMISKFVKNDRKTNIACGLILGCLIMTVLFWIAYAIVSAMETNNMPIECINLKASTLTVYDKASCQPNDLVANRFLQCAGGLSTLTLVASIIYRLFLCFKTKSLEKKITYV